jgi:thiosulfate/3-mercaptopyruvate sulfurtransferase
MSCCLVNKRAVATAAFAALCLLLRPPCAATQGAVPPPASALSIPTAQLIKPDELNHLLQARGAEKPLILQVGSHMMFAQAHIAGSEYAGPGSQPEGAQQLRSRVASLRRSRFIVIYCGCCPWNRCPNVGPAYNLLTSMGFTRVKVLFFANNFGADWAGKGYPVESSQ